MRCVAAPFGIVSDNLTIERLNIQNLHAHVGVEAVADRGGACAHGLDIKNHRTESEMVALCT